MVKARYELMIASISLIVGSMAAPLLYIIDATVNPQGFADLRHASTYTFLYYFVFSWSASALLTAIVGAPLWQPLHRREWDGFASYALLAAGVAALIGLLLGVGMQNWEAVVMAATNGLAVRAVERTLRSSRLLKDSV